MNRYIFHTVSQKKKSYTAARVIYQDSIYIYIYNKNVFHLIIIIV